MNNEIEFKKLIENGIKAFAGKPVETAALDLFKTLGYSSTKRIEGVQLTGDNIGGVLDSDYEINKKNAFLEDWKNVVFLFQLTDEEINRTTQMKLEFDSGSKLDNKIMTSYLFFAVELSGEDYSRTNLAKITREINRLLKIPVMVLYRYRDWLTIAIINRRPNKKDSNQDVLEKVTLIKDIRISKPHRAHTEILFDLSLPALAERASIHNFIDLQAAWQKVLDSAALNKKFYQEISNWYHWATRQVIFPNGAGENEETRNAVSVIRLITRMIFIWFLKEKGLVPGELFNKSKVDELLDYQDAHESTYYKAILQNLFFATLNQEMNTPGRRDKRDFRKDGQHYNNTTLYRYKTYFRDPERALRLFENIPFLNGGLFECLDKPEENGKVVRVDGFSDRPDNEIKVPDDLFFGVKRNIDLNTVYDTKSKKYEVRGLLHVLDSYKFTIEENTPVEEEVALDPELLGKVFENLLAAFNPETKTTARKATGSYYTPREIVDYMVNESLIAYLETKLDEKKEEISKAARPIVTTQPKLTGESQAVLQVPQENEPRLRHLLEYNHEAHQFNESEVNVLLNAIDQIKVLDPACGSGAFPMGVLHKLVFILNKLDPGNVKWKGRQIEKASEIPDTTVRDQVIEDIEKSFSDNELEDYGRKLYLVENCIYGVDIQPTAVQIAKLRFFISLVVDQNTNRAKPNLGIRPLPNLESKFVSANTLISIEKPQQMLLHNPEIDGKEKKLAEVRDSLFTARTPATKHKYRELDKQLRAEITTLLKNDGWSNATAAQLANWDPFDQNTSADFFDQEWMFGIGNGFDIVLGNPPYIQLQTMHEKADILQKRGYQTFARTGDVYCLFYERGIQLLHEKGILTFITSNKWMRAGYGEVLRNFFAERTNPVVLVDFSGQKIFESATVDVNILIIEKARNKNSTKSCVITDASSINNLSVFIEQHSTVNNFSINKSWSIHSGIEQRIKNKIEEVGLPLRQWNIQINYGIKTGLNEAFIISGEKKNELIAEDPKSAEIIRPILRGRDIKRYGYNFSDLWLINTHNGMINKGLPKTDVNEYPAIKTYLDGYYENLERRYDKGDTPYNLRSCDYLEDFYKQKIIYPNMTKYLPFYLDYNHFMTNQKCFIVTGEKLAYLTAFFNSSLFKYCFRDNFPELLGGTRELSKIFFENIPILGVDIECSNKFEDLVINIQKAKLLDPDTRKQELEIDNLIFDLYGLTSEEKALIGFIEIT